MTRLFKLLFPHASTSADLAQVEKELQAQINALRSRLDVAAAQAGVTHETNEIILGSLRGRVTALEAGLNTAIRRLNAQANLIDALETEVSRPLAPEIEARLNAVRTALENATSGQTKTVVHSGAAVLASDIRDQIASARKDTIDAISLQPMTSLIVSDGEAKPTEVIRLKAVKPKGRGPKGGAK